jgi:hypothetical protein
MRSPFPGMDPYLEPHWRDVHASLVIYARDALQAQLPGGLLARVEERVFVESESDRERAIYPDVRVVQHPSAAAAIEARETAVATAEPVVLPWQDEPVTETFIEIVEAGEGNRVITVVEFLSLANKAPGPGQQPYLHKQFDVLEGGVSLVEIDLLRAGQRVIAYPGRIPRRYRTTYQVCVGRSWVPRTSEIYAVPLRARLPTIRVPLRRTDADAQLNLQELIDLAYRNGRYAELDYRRPPEPPLDPDDERWADELLRAAGKR